MEKVERVYTATPIGSSGRQFVRCEEFSWDSDGVKNQARNGFIEVQPGKGEHVAQLLREGKRQAIFGAFSRQQGLNQVSYINPEAIAAPADAPAAGTLATQ